MPLHGQDRVCIPVPFYHCFGMVLGNLGCTTHGAAHGRARRRRSSRRPPSRPCRKSGARACTACRRCSSPSSADRTSRATTCRSLRTGDHGRVAVPGRGDEAGASRHAHGRGHDLLRHDRDLAGLAHRPPPTTHRPARRIGRPGPPSRRGRVIDPARSERAARRRPASSARAATP